MRSKIILISIIVALSIAIPVIIAGDSEPDLEDSLLYHPEVIDTPHVIKAPAVVDISVVADTMAAVKPGSVKKGPPDSAYIARASDSSWWKRSVPNNAFGVGEYLEFKVSYGVIPAGTAILRIPEIIEYNGVECYKVQSTAHSNGFVSTFYKVRDTAYTYIDCEGIFPHYFRKRLSEGKYNTEKETIFDQRRHLAITDNDTIPTYPFVQDAFSSMYYIRTHDLDIGKDLMIDTHTSKKNFPLKVIVHGRDTVEVGAGKFNCIVVEPVMREEGIFKAKGSIRIWLTDDQYKMPVKMQTEVFFLGSIHADLKNYKYGDLKSDSSTSSEK